jgi:hypothetical protein
MRQKTIEYDLPIYEVKIILVYYRDHRYANKQLAKRGITDVEMLPTDAGAVWKSIVNKPDGTKGTRFCILIDHNDDLAQLKNTIAHECLHLTQEILETLGIPFKKNGHNEPYTYLNAYLQGVVENLIC